MERTINNIKKIFKKVQQERKNNSKNEYSVLNFEELECYYYFAYNFYLTKGKFVYTDTQSPCQYIDNQLVYEFLKRTIQEKGYIEAIEKLNEFENKYMYETEYNGKKVSCTAEGKSYIENEKNNKEQNVKLLSEKNTRKKVKTQQEKDDEMFEKLINNNINKYKIS